MYGQSLYGGLYGGTLFGVFNAESAVTLKRSTARTLFRPVAVITTSAAKVRNADLDIVINVAEFKGSHYRYGFDIHGEFEGFGQEAVTRAGFSASGVLQLSYELAEGFAQAGFGVYHVWQITRATDNDIKWAMPGTLDFELGRHNLSGHQSMSWNGFVYGIHQIGKTNKMVVYGAGGVSLVVAVNEYFGETVLLPHGIYGKHSVVATPAGHLFLDVFKDLWTVGRDGSLKNLGYRDRFDGFTTDLIMAYHPEHNVVYICDDTRGAIYCLDNGSLFFGPAGITSIGYNSATVYVLSHEDTIDIDPVSFETNVYDMGARRGKTVFDIEIGSSNTDQLLCSLGYVTQAGGAFVWTPWINFINEGKALLSCYGIDFKLKIKADEYIENFTLDYVKINGVAHRF